MSSRFSAPVESIMRGVSSFNVGTIAGRDPVAMTIRSKVSDSSEPSAFVTRKRRGIFECSAPLHVVNFALLREHAQAARKFLDYAFLPRAQAGEIDLRRSELDAPVLGLMRLFHQFRDVQQCLRWNASAVKADSARIQLWIDQCDGHAEIGGEKCGGVSTRTAANDCNI